MYSKEHPAAVKADCRVFWCTGIWDKAVGISSEGQQAFRRLPRLVFG